MDALISVVAQSLILGVMVLGVYISYRILDFPDLSVDGSFALGGAIICFSLERGISPIVGSLLAFVAGLIAGFLTGVIHVKFKISNLLSGILVMGILYSINLRIMGKANIPLFNVKHLFKGNISPMVLSLVILLIFKILLDIFLQTGFGYTLKAVGDNSQMVKSLGIEVNNMKVLGLMLSNGVVAFSGSIMAQFQGFSDVSMGAGTLVLAIASIIIGQTIFGKIGFLRESTIILLGTIIYQITIYMAMSLGMPSTDLKMITSLTIILFLSSKYFSELRSEKILKVKLNDN